MSQQSILVLYLLIFVATGKKARFEEVPKWQDLDVYGIRALEIVKLIFGFCQKSGGQYFGDEIQAATALGLKKKAAEACSRSYDNVELQTLEDFFAARFSKC
jgi:hypothetical protein